MKLSNIKTADQLILALAYEGFRKEQPANGPIVDPEPGPFYVYGYWAAAIPVPELSIYPQQLNHGVDLFLSAVLTKSGQINHWELNHLSEQYNFALHSVEDVTTDPESIGELLQGWLEEICRSHF